MRCLYCGSDSEDPVCASCGESLLQSAPSVFVPALPVKRGILDHIGRTGSLTLVLSSPQRMRTESRPQSFLSDTLSGEEELRVSGILLKEMGLPRTCRPDSILFLSGEGRDMLSRIILLEPRKLKGRKDDTLVWVGNLHYLLAKGLEGLGGWTEAARRKHLETARKFYLLARSDATAKGNIGLVCLELGEDKKALKYLDEALKERRKDAVLWLAKGMLLRGLGKLKDSMKCLERASNLAGSDPRIWTEMGRVNVEMSKLEDALSSFNEAIVRDGMHLSAWRGKAETLLKLGRREDANEVLEKIRMMVGESDSIGAPIAKKAEVPREEAVERPQVRDQEDVRDFLLRVEGIGETKAEAILAHGIGSIEELSRVPLEDLTGLKGVSEKIARNIKKSVETEGSSLSPDEEDMEDIVEKARSSLEEGDYERALARYERLIEMDPENEQAWFNKAEVLQELGRMKEAIEAYDRVISFDEGNVGAWMEKAAVLLEMGKPLDAVECYKRVLEMNPENADRLVERARALAEGESHEAAVLCYDIILDRFPENYEANIGMVLSLLRIGDLDRAETWLERAERTGHSDERLWWAKGNLMNRRGRWGAAIQLYDRAISLRWDFYPAWIGKGEIFLREEKFEKAKRCFDKALEMDARNADAWLGKARALSGMGQNTRALEWLDDYMRVYPEDERARELRDEIRSESPTGNQPANEDENGGSFAGTLNRIVKAIRENADEEAAWMMLGDVLLNSPDPRAILERLEGEISDVVRGPAGLTNEGAVLLRVGEYEKALECFDMALSMDEKNARAKELRERCLEEMGKVR